MPKFTCRQLIGLTVRRADLLASRAGYIVYFYNSPDDVNPEEEDFSKEYIRAFITNGRVTSIEGFDPLED